MSFNYFERVIRFISTHLDYCNGLYVGINQAGLPITHLQMVQNAAGTLKREHITPILASVHWLSC